MSSWPLGPHQSIRCIAQDKLTPALDRQAWFLFDVGVKSVFQFLRDKHSWQPGKVVSTDTWAPQELRQALATLVARCSDEGALPRRALRAQRLQLFHVRPAMSYYAVRASVRRRAGPSLQLAKDLNEALAYFVTDLLTCWDRKTVFDAVREALLFSTDNLAKLTSVAVGGN